jgi:hypothetical protein
LVFYRLRLQAYPSDRLKIELWLVNGWQTYAMFNEAPGIGVQFLWRPKEAVSILSSYYVGWDTPNTPQRLRFHTDNNVVFRYLNQPASRFISKAAFSITGDLGFEQGGGVKAFKEMNKHRNRILSVEWSIIGFGLGRKQQLAFTVGGGFIDNPGRYLALLPPAMAC